MSDKGNYWNMKNDELIALLVERKIDFDPDDFDRKFAVEHLVKFDADAGDLQGPVGIDDEGNAGKIKIKNKYVDIVFHNQEGHPKYVFLGLKGQFLYLPRECVCRIPADFMGVIRDAVSKKLVQINVEGRQSYKEVRTPRLSYEIVAQGEK